MSEVLSIVFRIFGNWYWIVLPVVLWFPAKFFYFWWIRWEVWYPSFKWILLEIKPPREVLKPFRAMEDVFSVLWGIYDSPNWREKWCQGEFPLGGGLWFSLEIVSIGGEIHFYIRIPKELRNTVESAIYSQYPEAEIYIADDYTKNVPKTVPNKEWDLYGENITLLRPDYYPIKTYESFFEKKPEAIKEEKRIDPMNHLLEHLAKLKSGEQFWLQIVCNPITDDQFPWQTPGKEEIKRIGKRVSKRWFNSASEASPLEVLVTGKVPETPQAVLAKPWPPGELMPKEQEIIKAIEDKIKKWGFQVWIRVIYLYKKNEPHDFGNYKIGRSYFNHFTTEHLNGFVFYGPTRTRIHYLFPKKRLYLRKRKQFREYIDRLPPLWPRTMRGEPICSFGHRQGRTPGIRGTFVLNIEELATIFHFPAKIVTPAITPVETKKGGPPPGLPTED